MLALKGALELLTPLLLGAVLGLVSAPILVRFAGPSSLIEPGAYRSAILLVTGSLGYIATFSLIARSESDAWIAAAFGIIPLAVGLGFFLDYALIRRDLHRVS